MKHSLQSEAEDQPVGHDQVDATIVFSDGLVGLPLLVRHRLSAVPETALYEMVSQDDPTIGFIAASADNVKPGTTDRLRERGLVGEDEWVLAILAVHGEPPAITANLAGPLIVDMRQASARQLVIEDPEFPLQAPVSEAG
jgi:flagellar assembly factor FliW